MNKGNTWIAGVKELKFYSKSSKETLNIAYKFAQKLNLKQLPIIILLKGEIGAGKTTFVKGFLNYFSFKNVRSPSFIIINEYSKNHLKVYHIDFYRLSEVEIERLGIEEIFKEKAIILIEWFENFKKLKLEKVYLVEIKIVSFNEREIHIYKK
jgi:tRNA threonylcarbamoyladenosine biosynthesis protein TsaE